MQGLMAKALKCDRCGKLYAFYGANKRSNKYFNTVWLRHELDAGTVRNNQIFDLCEECRDGLAEFIFGGESCDSSQITIAEIMEE